MALMRGVDFSWGALPHTGAFATSDGALVVVGAFKENPETCWPTKTSVQQ